MCSLDLTEAYELTLHTPWWCTNNVWAGASQQFEKGAHIGIIFLNETLIAFWLYCEKNHAWIKVPFRMKHCPFCPLVVRRPCVYCLGTMHWQPFIKLSKNQCNLADVFVNNKEGSKILYLEIWWSLLWEPKVVLSWIKRH